MDRAKTGVKNIYEYVRSSATANPEKIAVVDDYGRYTYPHLLAEVQKMAGAFKSYGIQKGDVVSFQLPNWVESIIIHQALAMIGAVTNPIVPIYRSHEMKYILKQSKTKMLLIPNTFRGFDYLEMIRSIHPKLPDLKNVIILDKYNENPSLEEHFEIGYTNFIEEGVPHEEWESVSTEDPALLLYTSGTTSLPKGVLHSHLTLLNECSSIIDLYELTDSDVVFMPSPVTHITGLLFGMEMPFMIQGKVVLQDIWDPKRTIQYLLEEKCTWTMGATPFLKGITSEISEQEAEEIHLKFFCCGGADVPPDLVIHATKILKCHVSRAYGSSEFPTLCACGPNEPIEKAAYTDGKLFKKAQAKVVDKFGQTLPLGEVGELAITGPELFLGYNREEDNKTAFLEDGYFLTGDLGVLDREGYIEIKGRIKEIIIRGGENISVKEVETILYRHPKILSVAIVALPDEKMGERGCACVVLKEGVQTLDLAEMNRFLVESGISKQKLPEQLEIMEELPTTASGKIQKFVLKENLLKKVTEESK
ncbi:AMP-binding protein [Sporosarcina sp. FSL W7-1349]|uniref:AMP-binding protein n=1 Tax=Sporosarcina sp. FSL W7-1349 TaxID=2921561 RepID=UPI0030F94C0B